MILREIDLSRFVNKYAFIIDFHNLNYIEFYCPNSDFYIN